MKKIFLAVAMMALCGCALVNKPTPEEIASADYGSYPEAYQEIIKDYMLTVFFDPSPVYRNWVNPSKSYVYGMRGTAYGYKVCVDANARNRMGGYTGFQTYKYLIRNGSVYHFDPYSNGSGCY